MGFSGVEHITGLNAFFYSISVENLLSDTGIGLGHRLCGRVYGSCPQSSRPSWRENRQRNRSNASGVLCQVMCTVCPMEKSVALETSLFVCAATT